jgi:hypothetical protein
LARASRVTAEKSFCGAAFPNRKAIAPRDSETTVAVLGLPDVDLDAEASDVLADPVALEAEVRFERLWVKPDVLPATATKDVMLGPYVRPNVTPCSAAPPRRFAQKL